MLFDRKRSSLDFTFSIAAMATSSKRTKVDIDSTKTLIYIIPQKIQKRRLDILVTRSREKVLPITDIFWYVFMNAFVSFAGQVQSP